MKHTHAAMYDNYRNPHPPGMQIPPPNPHPGPYDNPLYGASSGLIKTGLGVYGEKFLGSNSEFMHSNISRYFSNPQYYFHVNDQCQEQVESHTVSVPSQGALDSDK